MKSRSRKRTPKIVDLTVRRRYLTEREVERPMDCARKYGRYGHRDATMILVAYRHGLRANLKPKSPPYRGSHIEVQRQDKMKLASRLVPPPHAAHPPRRLHPALRWRCAPAGDACGACCREGCRPHHVLFSPRPRRYTPLKSGPATVIPRGNGCRFTVRLLDASVGVEPERELVCGWPYGRWSSILRSDPRCCPLQKQCPPQPVDAPGPSSPAWSITGAELEARVAVLEK